MKRSSVYKALVKKILLSNVIICSGLVHSADSIVLPEPLTLEYALSLSKNINPVLAFRLAEKNKILSEQSSTDAEDGFNLSISAQVNWLERANASTTKNLEEQKLSLLLTKPIYDFGKNKYRLNASEKLLDGNIFNYQNDIYLRQIKIMEAYFSVLLADLRFHRHNENMAISFISWDRSKKRNEIGIISELEVEKKHSEYQTVRRQRFEGENRQRQTRNRLAILMYSNGQLATTLATPEITARFKVRPEIDALVKKAYDNNLELKALRKQIESLKSKVLALKSQNMPQLNFQSEAAAYANELTIDNFSRENWRVGVVINMPLYDSGKIDSDVAKIRSEIYRLESVLKQRKDNIQHELLSLKLKLDTLRFERDEAMAFNDYSELFLDEKRALYELEVKTTLGTAMVQISDAQYGVAKALYETLLTWAKIDVLVGEEPSTNLFKKK